MSEGTFMLLSIIVIFVYLYYEYVYKRTKYYKEKQINDFMHEADRLLNEYNTSGGLDKTTSLLNSLVTQEEQLKFEEELEEKSYEERMELMKKLIQSKEGNSTDKAAAQRLMLLLYQIRKVQEKYIRLMQRLTYRSIDDRLKATQDWYTYVKLFMDESSAYYFPHTLILFEEIEKRFDDKLEDSGK